MNSLICALPFRANGHYTRIADGELADVYLPHLNPFPAQLNSNCYSCGDRLDLEVTEDAVTVVRPCSYPDGITTVITLAVPSGQLLVSDDLRPVYRWDGSAMADYNSALGQAQATMAMAEAGCAFSPVGNTCPALYRTGKDRYVIASPGYDEDTGTEQLPAGWDRLAGIVTDLWAYSVADYAHWQSRGGNPAGLDWCETVIGIAPGDYQFTSHSGERSFNCHTAGTAIFAHIELLPANGRT